MFEKDAEEQILGKAINSCPNELDMPTYCQGFSDGYHECQKEHEWHSVIDGDLPKDDKQYLVMFYYNYRGKKEMSYGVRDNLHSGFEIHRGYTEQIIAWCEIPTFDKE